ncbi:MULTISPECIES: coenzyme F390 synthetase [Protofrankia]|uniref:Coenzyme F390 synthetase-like protein n=1 Tax=Candidatus Protofrankia datiscae TaxID=2716812 RepID=F8B4S1_9ACTN|nr:MULTISPECIES: coenzyme F390 synthetase [Protofrankia]AEH09126.1 coenzyme F390 synthetase-like protein [Candidatus Protofrankia datiscae]
MTRAWAASRTTAGAAARTVPARAGSVFGSRAAAAAFDAACASPLVRGHLRTLARLEAAEAAEVHQWQVSRLARFHRLWGRSVPYYRAHPEYLQACLQGRLDELPVLGKETVRGLAGSFSSPRVPARRVTTGGTGGRPLDLRISYASFFTEWAHIAHVWGRAGVRPTDPKITFRGGSLGAGFAGQPILFQPTYNHFLVSPFHLSDRTFADLLDRLGDFRPVAVWGYPSAVTPFAHWVARTGPHRALSRVRAVLLASEGAFDWQVALFREVFSAPVVRWYGQSEKVVFAGECPCRPGAYHLAPTYGLTEVVDGRIVGTGMTNAAMPLVRYDTEDAGTLLPPGSRGARCVCGSSFPVLTDVRGRWDQSLVYGADDEPISTAALNFHDGAFAVFDRFQFHQERRGEVELRVAAARPPAASDLARARHLLQERVGDRLRVSVAVVPPETLLSVRGKGVTVDQRYRPGPATEMSRNV